MKPLCRRLRRRDGNPGRLGLGLYILREIVRANRGTVDVIGAAARQETAFVVELPRA
jgi:signal transduction histidine kinase